MLGLFLFYCGDCVVIVFAFIFVDETFSFPFLSSVVHFNVDDDASYPNVRNVSFLSHLSENL